MVDLAAVRMDFSYRDWFPREPNVGYETLIDDCIIGDQTCSNAPTWWRKPGGSCSLCWTRGRPNHGLLPNYASGSDGPNAADQCCSETAVHGGRSDMAVELGINPITWTNDDMPELGGDIPLETCLAETREAGYSGTELGGKFPRTSSSSHRSWRATI